MSSGQHYSWGEGCEGWSLLQQDSLSIKLEKMPAHTAERLHRHQLSQQYFYMLSGEAVFEVEGREQSVKSRQGLHITAGQKHRIINRTDYAIEFLLISEPAVGHDRIEL